MILDNLPGLNCGICGYPTCAEFLPQLTHNPDLLKRCIYLSKHKINAESETPQIKISPFKYSSSTCGTGCGSCHSTNTDATQTETNTQTSTWRDGHDREIDFYLEHFPEDPGSREVIIPHNPILTRELQIQTGDILIGRPLGMSCGCPVTHCGEVINADPLTGVITWCVSGPLKPRNQGFKDLGYYNAQAYEGLVRETRVEIKIGMRYYFQPKTCMMQWRHSGLINYVNRTQDGIQVRIEGLWIG